MLLPVKGLDFLFRTLMHLETKDVCLKVAGKETEYFGGLQTLYRSLFDSGIVKYIGELNQKELRIAYAQCDCLVLPSFYDQCPQVMLEAQAMGKPVIISDRIGSKAIVEDGVNGFIVPYDHPSVFADIIEKMIKNRSLRIRMGKAARKKMEKMTLDYIADQNRQLFPTI